MTTRVLLSLLSILIITGCASAPRIAPAGAVSHVVLFWLKVPDEEAAVDRLIETSEEFRKIPGVLDVQCGTAIPSERPVVDDSYDLAVIVTCDNADALQSYLEHPLHKIAAEEIVKPLVERVQIYDIQTR